MQWSIAEYCSGGGIGQVGAAGGAATLLPPHATVSTGCVGEEVKLKPPFLSFAFTTTSGSEVPGGVPQYGIPVGEA